METLRQHTARRIEELDVRDERGEPLPVDRAFNFLGTRAITAKPPLIRRDRVEKDGSFGTRDRAKVAAELERLWKRFPVA